MQNSPYVKIFTKVNKVIKDKEYKIMSQPEPSQAPNIEEPKFGFNDYAEKLNGRAAMLGLIIALAIEYFSGKGLLTWLGLM
jgi:hypothetical protein